MLDNNPATAASTSEHIPRICWHGNIGGYFERTRNCRWPREADGHVTYGRCRSGRRWFWAASLWGHKIEGAHWLHGWEDTEELALEAARLAVMKLADGKNVCATFAAGHASYHLKDINRAKRAAKPPSASTDSKATEYLFSSCTSHSEYDSSVSHHFYRFQIVKKTAKRIYYLDTAEEIDEVNGEPVENQFPYVLDLTRAKLGFVDRQKLESNGEVRNRGRHWCDDDYHLFASLQNARDHHYRYRRGESAKNDLAKLKAEMAAAHPDRGGSSAAFIEARQRYVDARRRARAAG